MLGNLKPDPLSVLLKLNICIITSPTGNIIFIDNKMDFSQAKQACKHMGATLAKVGQIYAAWKLKDYDRCDAGWLADGSIRYPISRPRMKCSPTEAAVRFVSFPSKDSLNGVYCYTPQP